MDIVSYLHQVGAAINAPVADLKFEKEENGKWYEIKGLNYFSETDFYHEVKKFNFRVVLKDILVTRFSLVEFPGCCAILVSTGAHVNPIYRGKGVNHLTNELRQHIATATGYTAIICTDVETNIAERKTLMNNNWQDIFALTNQRTKNRVNISLKVL